MVGREDHESSEAFRPGGHHQLAVTTPASEVSESGRRMTAPLILAGTALAGLGLSAVLLFAVGGPVSD